MTFTTITFLLFYILFFAIYWMLAARHKTARNILIILGSYLFYGWWDWRFLILLLLSSLIDFANGWLIGNAQNQAHKKLFLSASLVAQLGLLAYFKYFNFFQDSFIDLLRNFGFHDSFTIVKIILPVGISFYTFQTLSYVIDVYYGKLKPTKNIIDFLAFVSFFPQLVAGPIERAAHMIPQFSRTQKFNYPQAVDGLRLMLWGFFKKLVIADTLSKFVDIYYNSPSQHSTTFAWLAILGFAFQIYCDFSGYSDIAMGCAKTLGFELMVNFRTPYFSSTFSEFWQRWHIALSTWFRDYVYIPLGGNRGTFFLFARNIFITFLLSGLWHGANYTFIIWGAAHAFLLIIERFLQKQFPQFKWPPLFVFFIVAMCWVPFRAKDITQMNLVYTQLFHFNGFTWRAFDVLGKYHIAFALVFILFLIAEFWLDKKTFAIKAESLHPWIRRSFYYAIILVIFLMTDFNNAPSFIYFQF